MQRKQLDLALEIITLAAKTAQEIRQCGDIQLTHKTPGDPLTRADLECDRILRRLQTEVIPGSAYYSEESVDDGLRFSARYVWVVDPIDGTREFVQGISEYSVSVALLHKGSIVFAAVANPNDSLVFGYQGKISVIKLGDYRPAGAVDIVLSRSEVDLLGFTEMAKYFSLMPVGSIAYKLALVAIGQFPGVFSLRHKNEWDVCAGMGLVAMAGLGCYDLFGCGPLWNQKHKIRGVAAGQRNLVHKAFSRYPLHSYLV